MSQSTGQADLVGAVLVAIVAGTIAVFWPWLQSRHKAHKFHGVIRRELGEIGPAAELPDGTPWWRYLRRRFVHEEVFARQNISANRDFLLNMHPDVLFAVSQLWIAFDKRDGHDWPTSLDLLAKDKHVKSDRLSHALKEWVPVVELHYSTRTDSGLRDRENDLPDPLAARAMFEARLVAFRQLLPITRASQWSGPSDEATRRVAVDQLTEWYYAGGGLLLSQESFRLWHRVRSELEDDSVRPEVLGRSFSELRTALKIDLGVRHADERDVPGLARSPADGDSRS